MLTKEDFLKNIGHFCTMDDGSKGFICKTEKGNPRVLHNLPEKYCGWPYSEGFCDDNAPEPLKKKFSRAWNVLNDYDVIDSGVKRILKSCVNKTSKKTKKSKETPKAKDTKQKLLTADEIKAGIGHLCKLSDGQEAFIALSPGGVPVVCMKEKKEGLGWVLHFDIIAEEFRSIAESYSYGWGITCSNDAKIIGVVEILESPSVDSIKVAESPKTILDMTVKELLEKLNEIIKC